MVASFACGLRYNSRVKMRLRGDSLTFEQMLLTLIFDCLNWIRWSKTKNGSKNINCPESLFDKLTRGDTEDSEDCISYDSAESYEAARKRILKGG